MTKVWRRIEALVIRFARWAGWLWRLDEGDMEKVIRRLER